MSWAGVGTSPKGRSAVPSHRAARMRLPPMVECKDHSGLLFNPVLTGRAAFVKPPRSRHGSIGMTADDRLIVALDVPNIVQALDLTQRLGDSVSFYKIGLGMLTGGGLALGE